MTCYLSLNHYYVRAFKYFSHHRCQTRTRLILYQINKQLNCSSAGAISSFMFMCEGEKKRRIAPLHPYFYVLKLHFALMGQCVIDVILYPLRRMSKYLFPSDIKVTFSRTDSWILR